MKLAYTGSAPRRCFAIARILAIIDSNSTPLSSTYFWAYLFWRFINLLGVAIVLPLVNLKSNWHGSANTMEPP